MVLAIDTLFCIGTVLLIEVFVNLLVCVLTYPHEHFVIPKTYSNFISIYIENRSRSIIWLVADEATARSEDRNVRTHSEGRTAPPSSRPAAAR